MSAAGSYFSCSTSISACHRCVILPDGKSIWQSKWWKPAISERRKSLRSLDFQVPTTLSVFSKSIRRWLHLQCPGKSTRKQNWIRSITCTYDYCKYYVKTPGIIIERTAELFMIHKAEKLFVFCKQFFDFGPFTFNGYMCRSTIKKCGGVF